MSAQVSVIIAAFNAQDTLGKAVESVIAQHYKAHEIIIVDDASSDDTLAVAKRYASRHENIKVLTLEENVGPSQARNLALNCVQGDWVAVLDADDAFLPERLMQLLTSANAHRLDMIADSYYLSPSQTQVSAKTRMTSLFIKDQVTEVDSANFVRHGLGSVKPLIRKAVIDKYQLSFSADVRSGEDMLLYTQLLMHDVRFGFLNTPLYIRTELPSSLSRGDKMAFLEGVRDVIERLERMAIQAQHKDLTLVDALQYRKEVINDALALAKWRTFVTSNRHHMPPLSSVLGAVRHLILRKHRYLLANV